MIFDMLVFGLIYIFYFYPKWRKKEFVFHTLFYIYLVAVFALTVSPFFTSLSSVFHHRYQPMMMEPFRDIIAGYALADVQIVLNILLFVPFGFLLSHIRKLNGKQVVLHSFILSVIIEVIQPLLHYYRTSDITDVICNTFGGLIGYLLFKIVMKLKK